MNVEDFATQFLTELHAEFHKAGYDQVDINSLAKEMVAMKVAADQGWVNVDTAEDLDYSLFREGEYDEEDG